jgi:IS5 family transposase
MRKRFESQIELGQTPIEKVAIPLRSRDELPPVLAGLQWIFRTPAINQSVFELLEKKVVGDKQGHTGRPGMDLWHILVLGVVRLGLDCDYDRIEHIANHDSLVRQIMGLPQFAVADKGLFHHRTISENICHIDEALLAQINAIVVRHGQPLLKKKAGEKLEIKTDSYVLETDVHYPTDANLLWDAARKSIDILTSLCEEQGVSGWRKQASWKKHIKIAKRICEKAAAGGGANKAERVQTTARAYLDAATALEEKINTSIITLRGTPLTVLQRIRLAQADYFHTHLIRHMDLLQRRLIGGETIPHEEKVFSLFEEHTELIRKGKVMPPVEFGHRLLISTEQHGLIVDYKVMGSGSEPAEVVPNADRLLLRFEKGSIQSISYDQGFSSAGDRELLELYIPEVIMPKKGRKREADEDRETTKRWKKLRDRHSAVESNINSLEHHGLGRCLDKGLHGYERCVGFGVLAYNLHKIGAKLLEKAARQPQRKRAA